MKAFPWWQLLEWYEKNGRHDLPWRDYTMEIGDLAYRVWISEIFLQQTQVERVRTYFEKVVERYPDITALAETDYETFFPYYKWLGYYSRARNLLKTAQIVQKDYGMIFPTYTKVLTKLPGIGPYTAEAIRAFGFGIATLAWDTNLEKVFSRYYYGDRTRKLSNEEKWIVWKDLLEYILEISLWDPEGMKKLTRDINNALMDYAAIEEKNEKDNIIWDEYIFRESVFYRERWSSEHIEKKKSIRFPIPDAHIVVILHQDHKVYYSLEPVSYKPFVLEPSMTRDTREYVQHFFRENYGLELSVRPIHKKMLSEDGKAYVYVHAQVQVWKVWFTEYAKNTMKNIDF